MIKHAKSKFFCNIIAVIASIINLPLIFANSTPIATDPVIDLLKKNELTVLTDELYGYGSLQKIPVDPLGSTAIFNHQILYEIYAQPIQVTEDRNYVSRILNQFTYDPEQKKLTLSLKPDQYYSDGSKIAITDIAMMITRVMRKRSSLEPFNLIKGAQVWLQSEKPLDEWPLGLGLDIQKSQLTIFFDKPLRDPYYWLTFPMVSLLPKACIHPHSAELICKGPPFSGPYEIASFQDGIISFKRRISDASKQLPDRFHLIATANGNISPYLNYLGDNHVADVARGFHFLGGLETAIKRNFKTTGFTENWNSLMLADTETKTFENKRVRQFFSSELRKTLDLAGHPPAGSIIPVLSPGYLDLKNLAKQIPEFSDLEKTQIINHLKQHPPTLEDSILEKTDGSFFSSIAEQTLNRLQIPFKKEPQGNYRFFSLCLESIDPIHALKFLIYSKIINSAKFSTKLAPLLIKKLDQLSSNSQDNQDFNREIFEDATISVMLSFGRFQILSKTTHLAFKEQFLRQDWHRFFEQNTLKGDK